MNRSTFAFAKRLLTMLCVVQCLVLSTQATTVILDQMLHTLGVVHAPIAIAGPTIYADGDTHDNAGMPEHHNHADHHRDGAPVKHTHAGDGMLSPWVGVASYDVMHIARATTLLPPVLTSQDYPFRARQDRPPKSLA